VPVVVDIDAAELEGMALHLDLNRKAAEQAVRAAANRTARWARVQIARGLASRLGISPSVLQGKRLQAKAGRTGARVWIALNPLNVAQAGAKTAPGGLRAGRSDFRGAFLAKGRYGGRAGLRRAGRSRLPLESAAFDVLAAAPDEINRKAWPALNDKFIELYREELERRVGR
jgi:hypothetical protein